MEQIRGRSAVLGAAGDSLYVRASTDGDDIVGYHHNGMTAWVAVGPWGRLGASTGPAEGAEEAISLLYKETDVGWWQLSPEAMAASSVVPHMKSWAFMSAPQRPALAGPADRVTRLSTTDGVDEVLEAALPDAGGKPGDPRIRCWYGIFDGDKLAAVAADKSSGGVGFLSSIAVLPQYQGSGLGGALTTVMAQDLYAEFGSVALAVVDDNVGAVKLYARLGFTDRLPRMSGQFGGNG